MLFQALCIIHRHWSIKTGATVRKRQIRVKITDFLSRVTLKFDRWPWKTIGQLNWHSSSFVHHFMVIGQFKLKLQSGNFKFGSKSSIFFPSDLEIWRMTLKNNRAPRLCYFKLFPLFHSHGSIQTGVTVQKCQILVKIGDFFSRVTLKFDRWHCKTIGTSPNILQALCIISWSSVHSNFSFSPDPPNSGQNGNFLPCVTLKFDRWHWKTIGHLFYATSSCVHDFIAICDFEQELQSRNG